MKLNPPFAVLMLVCSTLAALAINRTYQLEQTRRAQCEVALAYLKGLPVHPRKPRLLLELPEEVLPMKDLTLGILQYPSWKEDPDFRIEIEKSQTAHQSPVKICANVRRWASKNDVIIDSYDANSETPDWLVPNKDDEYDWHIISLSMPVISADGKRAYLNESQYFGPLAGGGNALEYRKKSDGSWILVKSIGRYIS